MNTSLHSLRATLPAFRWMLCLCAAIPCPVGVHGADASAPAFQEVYDLLKQHLQGVTEAELNRAAVHGLLDQLGGRANLAGGETGAASTNAVSARLFDAHFGYVRITSLATGAEREFQRAFDSLRSTNKLKGLILDLRYAGGSDYPAAIALADRFLTTEQPLADWGEGWKKSTTKTNAITLPVTLLVNHRTTGTAEALAGMLRHRDIGLLLGTNTAGQASMTRLFPLKNGREIRIAVAPLKVADGRELPRTGLKPDISVTVAPDDEQAWYADAFKSLAKPVPATATNDLSLTDTNKSARRRINEAELVRLSREGKKPDNEIVTAQPTPPEPSAPVIHDPVLARALDLLKGLAVVQQFRAP
jgi:Peptidase family S41